MVDCCLVNWSPWCSWFGFPFLVEVIFGTFCFIKSCSIPIHVVKLLFFIAVRSVERTGLEQAASEKFARSWYFLIITTKICLGFENLSFMLLFDRVVTIIYIDDCIQTTEHILICCCVVVLAHLLLCQYLLSSSIIFLFWVFDHTKPHLLVVLLFVHQSCTYCVAVCPIIYLDGFNDLVKPNHRLLWHRFFLSNRTWQWLSHNWPKETNEEHFRCGTTVKFCACMDSFFLIGNCPCWSLFIISLFCNVTSGPLAILIFLSAPCPLVSNSGSLRHYLLYILLLYSQQMISYCLLSSI